MSENKAIPVKANERPKHAPTHRSGPGHGPMSGSGEKAANFKVSVRRLLGHLRPQRAGILLAIALGVWLAMAGGWLGFLFVSMVLYQALYSVISARRRPGYLVVLGAGLVDGRVGLLFVNLDSALADLLAGRVRALAVSSARRHPLLPEVPTLAESGLPGFEVLSWSGLMVARGTPAPVVERLEAALRRVMASAEMQRAMQAEGLTLPPAGAEAHAQLLAREITRWQRLVHDGAIMLD